MSTRRFSEVRRRTGPEPADSNDDVEEVGLREDRKNLRVGAPLSWSRRVIANKHSMSITVKADSLKTP